MVPEYSKKPFANQINTFCEEKMKGGGGFFKLKWATYLVTTLLQKVNGFDPLNAKLNPICHLLALLGAHHILHVSRIRVNVATV
jgi:hypothetical protein